MADLELKDLISFDELVTPHIVPIAFWATQALNAFFWMRRLVATAVSTVPEAPDPTDLNKMIAEHTVTNWGAIVFCMLALVTTIVLIRVGADLLLCIFRWQASTRGILMAMTGAPAALAAGQAEPAVAPPSPAPAARPAAVSASPPWEAGAPQAPTPSPAPSAPQAQPPQPPPV